MPDVAEGPPKIFLRPGITSGFCLLEALVFVAMVGLSVTLLGPRLYSILATSKSKIASQQLGAVRNHRDAFDFLADDSPWSSSETGWLAEPSDVRERPGFA